METPGEVDSSRDVAPLVRSAALQHTAVRGEEVGEVVGLEQLVRELGERDTLVALDEAPPHGFAGDHLIDREVLADIPQEGNELELPEPIMVVQQEATAWLVQIEHPGQLAPDAGEVGSDSSLVQQLSLVVTTRRIADAPGTAAGECDRAMAGSLQPGHRHHAHQVTDVQGRARGVETDVIRDGPTGERGAKTVFVGDVLDEAAGPEQVQR